MSIKHLEKMKMMLDREAGDATIQLYKALNERGSRHGVLDEYWRIDVIGCSDHLAGADAVTLPLLVSVVRKIVCPAVDKADLSAAC